MLPVDVAELQTALVVIVDNVEFLMSRYKAAPGEVLEVKSRREAMQQARSIVLEKLAKYSN